MTLEKDLEIGEYYRNRTSNNIYVIIYIDDTRLKYVINEIHQQASVTVYEFKEGMKKGLFSRIGKMNKCELAKYLLQR
ncbi:MAG: hypothetical protein ACOCRK_11150 [bacterium]